MKLNKITEKNTTWAVNVQKGIGSGFLESVYQAALAYGLNQSGLVSEKEKALLVKHGDIMLKIGFKCDFLVENKVIVERKAVKELCQVYEAQLLNYLKPCHKTFIKSHKKHFYFEE